MKLGVEDVGNINVAMEDAGRAVTSGLAHKSLLFMYVDFDHGGGNYQCGAQTWRPVKKKKKKGLYPCWESLASNFCSWDVDRRDVFPKLVKSTG